jgi:hypothetical protein
MVRKNIFVPWKVLQSEDLAIHGGINFKGIETLRQVEQLQPHQQGFLPSRSSLQACSVKLHEKVGQHLIPFKKVENASGEMFLFDPEKMVRFLLKTFQLHEKAQREPVEMCITLDGAQLTKDLCHLTFGIKITDCDAIDPRDGTLACQEDGIYGNIFKMQSCNYCFIVKTFLGKDSKDIQGVCRCF